MTLKELIIINKQVSLIRLERFGDSAVVFSLTHAGKSMQAHMIGLKFPLQQVVWWLVINTCSERPGWCWISRLVHTYLKSSALLQQAAEKASKCPFCWSQKACFSTVGQRHSPLWCDNKVGTSSLSAIPLLTHSGHLHVGHPHLHLWRQPSSSHLWCNFSLLQHCSGF